MLESAVPDSHGEFEDTINRADKLIMVQHYLAAVRRGNLGHAVQDLAELTFL